MYIYSVFIHVCVSWLHRDVDVPDMIDDAMTMIMQADRHSIPLQTNQIPLHSFTESLSNQSNQLIDLSSV